MDWVEGVVNAADSGWAVLAIALIGAYVLLWKYGGELLKALHENTEVTKETKAAAEGVAESIVTNHGSRNLGDAIDRLTEWMSMHIVESRNAEEQFKELNKDFYSHLNDYSQWMEDVSEALTKLTEQKEDRDEQSE